MTAFLTSKESHRVKRPDETRAVKAAPVPKRKRRVAGPKVAPLIAMPTVPFLSDDEWQPFLQLLPARPQPKLLRSELDRLMITFLGILEAEASSPSAREVATVLEDLAQRAQPNSLRNGTGNFQTRIREFFSSNRESAS